MVLFVSPVVVVVTGMGMVLVMVLVMLIVQVMVLVVLMLSLTVLVVLVELALVVSQVMLVLMLLLVMLVVLVPLPVPVVLVPPLVPVLGFVVPAAASSAQTSAQNCRPTVPADSSAPMAWAPPRETQSWSPRPGGAPAGSGRPTYSPTRAKPSRPRSESPAVSSHPSHRHRHRFFRKNFRTGQDYRDDCPPPAAADYCSRCPLRLRCSFPSRFPQQQHRFLPPVVGHHRHHHPRFLQRLAPRRRRRRRRRL